MSLDVMKKTNSEKSVQVDLILLLNPSGIYEERFIKKMDGSKKRKIRTIVFICLVLAISGIIGFGYFCNDKVCALSRKDLFQTELPSNKHTHNEKSQLSLINNPGLSYDEVQNDDFQNGFDIDKYDVMVFLHIQKTGGTSFGKHLVRDLDLKVSIEQLFEIVFFCFVYTKLHYNVYNFSFQFVSSKK